MKPGQVAIAVIAAVAVAIVAVLSAGGGGDGGDGGSGGEQAPQGALRIPFAYSPEKEKLLVPLIREFNSNREQVGGKAVFVDGEVVSSGEAESQIADGRREPVVWSPASS